MSLNSNGELNVKVKYKNDQALTDLVVLLEDELRYTIHVDKTGKNKQVQISTYVQDDHFYVTTVTNITNKVMAIDGITVLELESEIFDEEGKHTKVKLMGNELIRLHGEVIYTHFDVIKAY